MKDLNIRTSIADARATGKFRKGSGFLCLGLFCAFVGGCNRPAGQPATQVPTATAAAAWPSHAVPSSSDTRRPLPLPAHMAAHQRENMRDHLATIQEILAALAAGNFAGVETSALRIGYTEEMGQMCNHMGAGAPGFTEVALHFHRTADTIGVAAKTRDPGATLNAVSATLQTCVSCHATYRQEIVDEATWEKITAAPGK